MRKCVNDADKSNFLLGQNKIRGFSKKLACICLQCPRSELTKMSSQSSSTFKPADYRRCGPSWASRIDRSCQSSEGVQYWLQLVSRDSSECVIPQSMKHCWMTQSKVDVFWRIVSGFHSTCCAFFFIRGVLFLVSLEVLSLIKTLMATYCPLLECASPKLMRTFASSPFDVTYLG